MYETISNEWEDYNGYIYTGDGNLYIIQKTCNGEPVKCSNTKAEKMSIYDANAEQAYNASGFIPCYFEWFKTFDTTFLVKIKMKYGPTFDAHKILLTRVIKGKADVFITDVYLEPVMDSVTFNLVCPDLR